MKRILKKTILLSMSLIMLLALVACGNNSKGETTLTKDGKFPIFKARGLDGKEYTNETFKENAVTVANFWFTGCGACIEEMPELERISKEWLEKDVKLVGICSDANTEEGVAEAKKILAKSGVTYPNLVMQKGEEIDKLMSTIVAFPTTLLIDREGNIIGEPIVGAIDTKEQQEMINKKIDDILAKDSKEEVK
ncbi:MAG: TlpA disulfide reductase family protein [Peptoniphilus sp.]|uniref:TlpA family protein disulfide reductase n=1 Tax=Peptoniphilus sp. TaxID=1971214 RepID=UPI002A757B50|nr:TlpA disulfide reductase family protein [Peptoniphilus sp.]MDY2987243.1 TlpA disulfide reductase family protein [Peptoniphilus sp.]